MVVQRARQVHEKEERRQAILGAALELFVELGFQRMTMTQIAQKSKFAKGTIYIYYKTKEELFLHLTEAGLLEFFESLDEALIASREPLDPESLSALVLQSLDSQPQLPRLLSILHTMLEHNVDRLTVLKFREFLATRVNRSGRHLERRLPFLCPAQGVDLILLIHCLVLGTWQVSDSAPVVKACLDAPGLHIFDRPFGPLFSSSLAALVSGLRSQADSPDSAIEIPARS